MKRSHVWMKRCRILIPGAAAVVLTGCAGMSARMPILLSGAQEVPVVQTGASGRADLTVDWFKCPAAENSNNCPTLVGTVATVGTNPTLVEIRQGVPGQNGPLIVKLVKTGDSTWQVPSGVVLTPAQYEAYQQGQLYVNVDSTKYVNGELRAQLRP